MSEQTIIAIGEIIIGGVSLLIWVSAIILIIIACILSKIYESKFNKAAIEVLKSKKNTIECTRSLKNIYSTYRRHRFGLNTKKVVPLCQDLLLNLRNGKGLDSFEYRKKNDLAFRLEEIIKCIQDEEVFDDEKANEIISETVKVFL